MEYFYFGDWEIWKTNHTFWKKPPLAIWRLAGKQLFFTGYSFLENHSFIQTIWHEPLILFQVELLVPASHPWASRGKNLYEDLMNGPREPQGPWKTTIKLTLQVRNLNPEFRKKHMCTIQVNLSMIKSAHLKTSTQI